MGVLPNNTSPNVAGGGCNPRAWPLCARRLSGAVDKIAHRARLRHPQTVAVRCAGAFSTFWTVALCASASQTAGGATLRAETLEAWEEYIQGASAHQEQRLRPPGVFLWTDEAADRAARVRKGEIVTAPAGPEIPKKVPFGLIHHWIGAKFVPGVTIPDIKVLRDYSRYQDFYSPDVVHSEPGSPGDSDDQCSMVLMKQLKFRKLALDAHYAIHHVRVDERRAYTIARTIRLQEIAAYGAADQHLLPENEGSGLIWRLYSITRSEERDGGLYLEIEAVALSRDIPSGWRFLVEPLVRHMSREALVTAIRQTEDAVRPKRPR